MNKNAIQFHLHEALEQIQSILSEIKHPDYELESLQIDMSHVYHHLNTAWNGRNCTREEFQDCEAQNFETWRKMPEAKDLLLDWD